MDSLAEKDIVSLVNELSPGYKAVFNMHVIEGYSHKEIAEILGITEGTSKSQLARAKGVLKKSIEKMTNKTSDDTINKLIVFMKNFKEKLYNYEANPPGEIWQNINAELDKDAESSSNVPAQKKI